MNPQELERLAERTWELLPQVFGDPMFVLFPGWNSLLWRDIPEEQKDFYRTFVRKLLTEGS